MSSKLMTLTDEQILIRVAELEAALFEDDGKLKNPQKVSYLSPVLQMYTGELSGRYARRASNWALGVAGLSLIVSFVSLISIF